VADFESADLSQREFAQEGGIPSATCGTGVQPAHGVARVGGPLLDRRDVRGDGVNPVAYLADVLRRAQTHPASRIDELLPHGCRRTRPESRMHTEAVHCSANA